MYPCRYLDESVVSADVNVRPRMSSAGGVPERGVADTGGDEGTMGVGAAGEDGSIRSTALVDGCDDDDVALIGV